MSLTFAVVEGDPIAPFRYGTAVRDASTLSRFRAPAVPGWTDVGEITQGMRRRA